MNNKKLEMEDLIYYLLERAIWKQNDSICQRNPQTNLKTLVNDADVKSFFLVWNGFEIAVQDLKWQFMFEMGQLRHSSKFEMRWFSWFKN